MPRCCAQINDPQTNTMTVYVEFQSDDEAKGLALAKEAAHEAHRKLHAEDPSRYPHDPKVDSFTKS